MKNYFNYSILIVLILLSATTLIAQQKEGKNNIDKLCGCFDVDFKYAETFSPDKNYKYHDRKQVSGRELVLVVESTPEKIVLQHILVANDTTVIKHWREDWVFEQPFLLLYTGNKKWEKHILPINDVKNNWVQSVWEVDDAPRYQGIGRWINLNGKTFWESTADAPLPRREYTTRNDYNILKRLNRIIVSDTAWLHEQDNQKINRTDSQEQLLAEEKGINFYKKIADSNCENAKIWWEKNGYSWNSVRKDWDQFIKTNNTVVVK